MNLYVSHESTSTSIIKRKTFPPKIFETFIMSKYFYQHKPAILPQTTSHEVPRKARSRTTVGLKRDVGMNSFQFSRMSLPYPTNEHGADSDRQLRMDSREVT